ncbi:hypothetical protein V6S66_11035 [Aeromicrobium sp. Sec7.5]
MDQQVRTALRMGPLDAVGLVGALVGLGESFEAGLDRCGLVRGQVGLQPGHAVVGVLDPHVPLGPFGLSPLARQVGLDPRDEPAQPAAQLGHGVGAGIGDGFVVETLA